MLHKLQQGSADLKQEEKETPKYPILVKVTLGRQTNPSSSPPQGWQ
jgi:hypothetical protein